MDNNVTMYPGIFLLVFFNAFIIYGQPPLLGSDSLLSVDILFVVYLIKVCFLIQRMTLLPVVKGPVMTLT